MSDQEQDDTMPERPPFPQRPRSGWAAWSATVGYIAQQYSPDATLKIEIYPMEHIIGWKASLTWGEHEVMVEDRHSLAMVLSALWQRVETLYHIFETPEDAIRKPAGFDDDNWLDERTYEVFSRLVNVTDTVFRGNWKVVVLYRPIEDPERRVQTRLIADDVKVNRGGFGPTLRDASRDLYHKAAVVYQKYRID